MLTTLPFLDFSDDEDYDGLGLSDKVLARIPPPTPAIPSATPSTPARTRRVLLPNPMDLNETEDDEVKRFMGTTCGCKLYGGKPCSEHFKLTHITEIRMSAMDLSHSELDMVILGQISACSNQSEDVVVESRHVATGRKHCYSSYIHQGKPVCPRMFRFLHAVGTFRNLKVNKTIST